MGNKASSESKNDKKEETTVGGTTGTSSATKIKEPENLFVQLLDMAQVSFLIYSFARLLAAARILSEENRDHQDMKTKLFELQTFVDINGNTMDEAHAKMAMTVFTPTAIETILQNNRSALLELKAEGKFDGDVDAILAALAQLKERVPANNPTALSLVQFDDVFQKSEIVYSIGKDEINQRITLVFRGTENSKLLGSQNYNWATNLTVTKSKIQPLPKTLQALLNTDGAGIDRVWVHSGYLGAVMSPTQTAKDLPSTTKYQQVLQSVQRSMKTNPGYQLYVTGHSLGAALSTLFSFFLACEPDDRIPVKPVINCNLASPRIGDSYFLKACQTLERHNKLRVCRVVNDKDSIAVTPSFNYTHVGFQVKLPRLTASNQGPKVSYPKESDSSLGNYGRLATSVNLAYDHSDYRERILAQEAELKKYPAVQTLYRTRSDLMGFQVTDEA